MSHQNTLIVIVGPTGIGKTALSISLATHYNCEIVSCDSRQFFKEMTIGTAVPSMDELQKIPHHFIQNKSIFENYSVGNFEKEAIAKLESLFKKNNIQIMVGGSGLYVDAVLNGLDNFPEIEAATRAQLKLYYEQFGIAHLQVLLSNLDPTYYEFLKNTNPQTLQNPQRMLRFLEVCIETKKPYSSFLNNNDNTRNFNTILIGLQADREIMYQRINQRVDEMVANGLVQEAQDLYEYRYLNALQTVGYREIFEFFDNNCTVDFAIDEIKKNTRRFSKRQITWFKRTENVFWFDYKSDVNKIIEKINFEIKKVLE